MKKTIMQTLTKIESIFGSAVFSDSYKLKGVIADILGGTDIPSKDARKIRSLVTVALVDLEAYTKLKQTPKEEVDLAIHKLVEEMQDYAVDETLALVMIDCIAEFLGNVPEKGTDKGFEPKNDSNQTKPKQKVQIPQHIEKRLFGGYEWRVLERREDKMLLFCEEVLMSDKIPGCNPYRSFSQYSEVKNFLNNDFYNSLSPYESERIILQEITASKNPYYARKKMEYNDEKIFLLSLEELVRYFAPSKSWEYFLDKYSEEYWIDCDEFDISPEIYDKKGRDAELWFLRTTGKDEYHLVDFFSSSVNLEGKDHYEISELRPALWLKL